MPGKRLLHERGDFPASYRDKNGFVTFLELEEYVQQEVCKWAAMRGRSQTPTAEKKTTGIIIMSETRR